MAIGVQSGLKRALLIAACAWLIGASGASAQVAVGYFDVTFPRPTMNILTSTGNGDCRPASAQHITPQAGVSFPTTTIQAGESALVTYEYECPNIVAQIIVFVSGDDMRFVNNAWYPSQLTFFTRVVFRYRNQPNWFEVGETRFGIDTEDWGANHGIDVGPGNQELLSFPGVSIFDIRNTWLDWTVPWND